MAQTNPFDSIFNPTQDDAAVLPGQQPVKDDPAQRYVPIDVDTKATSNPAPVARASVPTKADVIRRATELGVDPVFALSIWSQESGRNARSKDSPKGAVGGFQVMPDTGRAMIGDKDLRDPWNNMEAGLRYIAYGQKTLGTSDPALLAAGYHAGYDRKDLKAGIIPNTSDGMIRTADYARSVAARAGKTVSGGGESRFVPMSDDEVKSYQATGEADASRFIPMSDDEVAKLSVPGEKGSGVTGLISDVGQNLKLGVNMAAEDVRELVGRVPYIGKPIVEGIDKADAYLHDGKKTDQILKDFQTDAVKNMTPEMQAALDKKWWDSDKGTFGAAWSDPRAYMGGIVQSLPEQVLTMGPAMSLAKAAYGAKIAAGASTAIASQTAARTAMVAGVLSEGALGGAQSAREVREKIEALKPEVLAQSDAYKALLSQGLSPEEAQKALASDLSTRAFVTSGIVTGMFGGMGDRMIAKLFTQQVGGSAVKRALAGFGEGALAEGLFEEVPQSAGQQIAQNEAIRHANPKQSLTEDVANQALGGFVQGGLQGGVMGSGAAALNRIQAQPEAQPQPADQPRVEPTMEQPASTPPAQPAPTGTQAPAAPAQPAPAAPSGPLSAALDTAAEEHSPDPDRVTVTAPTGEQGEGKLVGYQEDENGEFVAQVMGDDGQVHTLTSQDGVKIDEKTPDDSGPMTSALSAAADQHAEAPAPAPAPVRPAKPAEPDYNAMELPELRERLKYIAQQAKASGGMTPMFMKHRKAVEKAIKAKTTEAMDASKPSEEPLVAGPHEDRGAANKMMGRFVEATGTPHEVVEKDGKFHVNRIKEQGDAGTDTAGNVPAVGNDADAGAATAATQPGDQQAGSAGVAQPAQERAADTAAPAAGAGPAVPGDGANADAQPALTPEQTKALKRIEKGTAFFGTPAVAQKFIDDHGITDTHEVKQTGTKRFEVKAKAVVYDDLHPDTFAGSIKKEIEGRAAAEIERKARAQRRKGAAAPATSPNTAPAEPVEAYRVTAGSDGSFTLENDESIVGESGGGGPRKFKSVDEAVTWAQSNGYEVEAPTPPAPAKPNKLEQGRERARRQEEAVRKAAENIAKRKAEKEAAEQPEATNPQPVAAAEAPAPKQEAALAPAAAIDAAANEAATSDHNDRPPPTEAQIESGNYKKGHITVHGLDITVENPRGSTRSGVDPDGNAWSHTMSDHYGYIKRTTGADGEQVDVYVGPKPESDRVYVVDQIDQQAGKFDEHKVMLGYTSRAQAVAAYKSNFDKGWKVGSVKGMSIDEFKAWLNDGDTSKPAGAAPDAAAANDELPAAAVADQPPPDEASEPETQAKAGSKVAEAGEELTYNRRNRIRTGLKWSDVEGMNDALKAKETVKAKVWPKPDYDGMIAGGMQPLVAHVVKQVYDAVSAKPQTRGAPADADFKRYIDGLHALEQGVMAWANDPKAVAAWLGKIGSRASRMLGAMQGQAVPLADLGAAPVKDLLQTVYPEGWRGSQNEIATIGGNKVLRALQPSTDEAVKALKEIEKGWPGKREAWQVQGYQVLPKSAYEVSSSGFGKFNLRLGGRFVAQFDTSEQAEAAMNEAAPVTLVDKYGRAQGTFETEAAAIEAARERVKRDGKDAPVEEGMNVADVERAGADRRNGEDVTAQRLMDEFSFRGINFGKWVPDNERQLHLNHAFDSFHDLAEILGVPPKAMSLNGMLGIAFGAQGGGKALAHFVPGVNEINITRTNGAGSLAHEWAHAIDHYFATQAGLSTTEDPFLTAHATLPGKSERFVVKDGKHVREQFDRFAGVRPEIVDAFKRIVDTMEKRHETPEEMEARVSGAKERAAKQVDRWLDAIRRDFKGHEERFDAIAAKIRAGDLGDGMVKAGKSYLAPRVNELRDLYKSITGRTYSLDQVNGLQSNVDHWQFLTNDQRASRKHEPQRVSTEYAKQAAELDKNKGGKGYWRTPWEMFARAFDAYVSDKLEAAAAKNTYLSHAGRNDRTTPAGTEREAISQAFADLIQGIEVRDEGGRPALYSVAGDAPAVVVDDELLDVAKAETANLPTYRLELDVERDQQGVIPGKPTSINESLKRGRYTLDDIAAGWEKTRAMLRARYGDFVTLYRADAPQREWNTDTQVVYMGDAKLARRFEDGERKAQAFRVPVDDVLGLNALRNGYYEFIVKRQGGAGAAAIRQMLADQAGEVTINRPGIGDITIPYGDKDAGLAHIAARRGQAFADRLPELLANGEVYTKPGQDRRIFIGNERDEAVIRTDRDGKPENWLLSAYEKYPEAKQSRTEAPAPYVRMSDGELKAALTHGPIGSVIARLIEHGTIQIHRSAKSLPKEAGKIPAGVQALTMPDGSMHLVAGVLTKDNARAVLLHEMFHGGVKPMLGEKAWGDLMGRMGSLYRQSEQSTGKAREFYDRARERVASAKAKGAVPTRMEVEEFAAYAIEEYERAPDSLPAAIRKWVEDLIGLIKAYIARRYGKQIGEITPAQLAGFAKMAILDMAAERRGEMFGPAGTLFSTDDERTVEVDGVRRPIRDSDGHLIEGGDFERQVQFWRRYDGPLDEAGRPILEGPRYSVGAAPTTQAAAGNNPAPSQPSLTPPEQGRLRRMQAAIQDNQNRVKQVQERIMELTGRTNLGRSDYYGAETNRPGRIAARLEDADDQMFQPLMEKIAKAGKTPEQLGELLHAMHAHERNEAVAKINPDMPDGGSGMTDAQANAILARYQGDTTLHALADEARKIARATLDLKHAYGLITDEHYNTLADRYEFYVPLKGDGEYGPKVKRAMGHEERDEHILENIARDYDQAVGVGEKNLARQSLLRMVLQFPDKDLWTVGVPPKGRYVAGKVYDVMKGAQKVATFDSQAEVRGFLEAQGPAAINFHVVDSAGERVAEFTKPLQDNEVMVYIKGDAVRIQIHDETLARQLRPLDAAQMNPILEFMRGINRFLSKIYTGYNPAFILRNATRDAMTGTINMLGNNGAAVAAKAWTKYPAAAKALGTWAATKKIPTGKTGQYLTEYRQQGGKVGASYMSDLEQQGETLQSMFDNARGVAATLRDGGKKRAASVAWNKSVGRLAHVVEVANQATENALRLGLFIALREEGVSAAKAAQAAKQVTVDFDRKGASTGALGAVYLFFNPAIQGSANALKTLAKGEHKQQAWAALGALALLGVYAASAGMGDDKDRWLGEEWEQRTKNLLLNVGGRQLRLPLSQEYAPVYSMGVALGEAFHGESPVKSAARVVSSFIDAYFPLQGAYKVDSDNHVADLAQAVTPTVFKPLTNTALNRNAFGSQIVPENEMTKDRADNLKMYRGTKNSAYDKAAQGIASVGEMMSTGKYENDITKVSPETLKEFWRTYTGGLGTFVTDSLGLAGMMTEPSQVEVSDVPIVKDFVRTQDVKPVRGRYFDLAREAEAAITEFEQAKKAGDGEAIEKLMGNPDKARLVGLGRMVRATSKAAAAIGDEKVDVAADPKLTGAEKRAKLKQIEQDEENLYRSAIEAFK